MEMIPWNIEIFQFLNNLIFFDPWFDNLVTFFAASLGQILIIFAVFFVLFHKYWHEEENLSKKEIIKIWIKESFVFLASAAAAWLITFFIKDALHIQRPFLALADANLLFEHGGGEDSFPSGHATFFAALSMAIFFYHRRVGWIYFLCTFLISLSRVIAGLHFPLDILAGWVIGIASAILFRVIVYRKPVLSGENSFFGVSRRPTGREAALRQQAETATPKKEFSPDSYDIESQ
ncbi:hypothetical protein A3A09_01060 [Candidatus Nomurabacteria bacterium RIFCSPLOWO2_01_FULL_42_20]|nr:MAG: hypothetical protein A3A09_01060 [Candidatus Nomurabacteria bacterium RIFCSPLOWO2_01_FULL_42_20]